MAAAPLTASEAAAHSFECTLDLAPADDGPCIIPTRNAADQRSPLSYSALWELRDNLSEALTHAGVPARSRVACALPSGPELASLVAVLPSSGFSFAPLNPELQEEEIAWELTDLPASALIVPAEPAASSDEGGAAAKSVARLAAARLGLPLFELVCDASVCGKWSIQVVTSQASSSSSSSQISSCSNGANPSATTRADVALVMHTSGTTRRPKVVPISHSHLASGALCVASTIRLTRDDTCLNAMPLFHLRTHALAATNTCDWLRIPDRILGAAPYTFWALDLLRTVLSPLSHRHLPPSHTISHHLTPSPTVACAQMGSWSTVS